MIRKNIHCSGKKLLAWLVETLFYCRYFYFLLIGFGAGLLERSWPNWFRYLMEPSSLSLVFIRWKFFTFISLRSKKQWIWSQQTEKWVVFSFLLGLALSFGWTPVISGMWLLCFSSIRWTRCSCGSYLSPCLYLWEWLFRLLLALASSLVLPYFNRLKPICCWRKFGAIIIWWEFSYFWDNWTVCHLSFS